MKTVFIILLTFSCYFVVTAKNVDTVYLKRESSKIDVMRFITSYTDSSALYSADSLLIHPELFSNSSECNNRGLTSIPQWYKITIKNTSDTDLVYIFANKYAPLNYVNIYDYVDRKKIKEINTGEIPPFSSRDISHRFFLLKLHLKPQETHTVLMRVDSEGDSLVASFELSPIESFLYSDSWYILFEGIIIGLIVLVLLVSVVYFIVTRDIISGAFITYVIAILYCILYLDGFAKQFLPNNSWFIERGLYLCMSISAISLGVIAHIFLRIKQHWPAYKYIFGGFLTTQAIGLILCVLNNPFFYVGLLIINIFAPTIFIIMAIASVISIRQKFKPAILLLISAILPGSGVISFILRDLGFKSLESFNEVVFKICYVFDIVILLVAIMYRLRLQHKVSQSEIDKKNDEVNFQKKQLEVTNTELKKLSITVQKTQNCIALFNKKGVMEWCNESFLLLYGFSQEETKSIIITELYSNESILSYMTLAQANNESIQFESLVITKEQKKLWVQTSLSPFYNEELDEHQFITIDSDISSLKLAQQELIIARDNAEEANRLKTAFLSNITHEIRTPLNSIIGFSQLLSIREYPIDKQQKFLQMITTNGNHLLDIISDIIDISKIEAGRMELRPKVFPLNAMLNELKDQYTIQLQNKTLAFQAGIHERDVKIALELGLDDDNAVIFTDQQRLKQVVINLMTNALKFTPAGSVVIGYSKRENDISEELMFFIRDTGIGMSEEELRIIFQRFRQGNEAISQHYGGTGLGLSISKGLIDLMGGNIWLESKKGKGTTVYFSVPYIKANTDSAIKNENLLQGFNFSKKTILVVEDEYFNFNVIKEILDETHCEILHAETGTRAMEIIENHKEIDLILMDIRLPDISGYEVTRKIRLTNKSLPVIAQTAYATEDVRYLCMKSGCNDYIAKPINPNYMLQLMSKYLRKRE